MLARGTSGWVEERVPSRIVCFQQSAESLLTTTYIIIKSIYFEFISTLHSHQSPSHCLLLPLPSLPARFPCPPLYPYPDIPLCDLLLYSCSF
jgi:hypothetical protein